MKNHEYHQPGHHHQFQPRLVWVSLDKKKSLKLKIDPVQQRSMDGYENNLIQFYLDQRKNEYTNPQKVNLDDNPPSSLKGLLFFN